MLKSISLHLPKEVPTMVEARNVLVGSTISVASVLRWKTGVKNSHVKGVCAL